MGLELTSPNAFPAFSASGISNFLSMSRSEIVFPGIYSYITNPLVLPVCRYFPTEMIFGIISALSLLIEGGQWKHLGNETGRWRSCHFKFFTTLTRLPSRDCTKYNELPLIPLPKFNSFNLKGRRFPKASCINYGLAASIHFL